MDDANPVRRRLLAAAIVVAASLGPAWLFLDPLTNYRLQTDDFAYAAASRTDARTTANLLAPHNTHIVPAWRVVCRLVVAAAGRLERLADVMAPASYGILVATMLAVGWLVRRETGSTFAGCLALAATGSTSIMEAAGTWFSASQTLWAGLGIVATLLCVQRWEQRGSREALAASVPLAWLAGGFWSVGHLAGLAGAAYLTASRSRWRRRGAIVPLIAALAAVAGQMVWKGRELETQVRVDGRTPSEAFSMAHGILYTLQAIPENLIFANLGLNVMTTALQGALLTLALATVWFIGLRRAGRSPSALERAGVVLIGLSYLAEYGIRGYKPFAELRGVAVPWYNTIPHIGWVLLLSGWLGGRRETSSPPPERLTARQGAAVLAVQAFLLLVNAPRVQMLWDGNLPAMTLDDARRIAADPGYRRQRALRIAGMEAEQQRRDLARLDRAEIEARRLGIGPESIRQAFGRVTVSELPEQYDAADLLDLPDKAPTRDPEAMRQSLGRWLTPPSRP